MSLNLAMVISADAKGVAPGTAEARREIEAVGKTAKDASTASAAGSTASAEAARQAATAHQVAASAATGRTKAELDLVRAAQAATAATALQGHEVTNLTRQFADLGVMLASGQSPLMAMITQGPQIADIFGQRGLRSILAGVVQGLMAMINPVTLTLTAITGLGYAASYAFGGMEEDVESANVSLEEHRALVERVVKEWGNAAPALQDYLDRLKDDGLNADRFAAVTQAMDRELAKARSLADDLAVDWVKAIATAQDMGVDPSRITAVQQAWAALKDDVRDGTAAGDDARKVFTGLVELLGPSGAGVDALSGQFADLARTIDAASSAARKLESDINPFGGSGGERRYARGGRPTLSLPDSAPAPERRVDPYLADADRKSRRADRDDPMVRFREQITTQREQLELLRLESQLVGANTAERELAIAAMKAEHDIRQAGIDASSSEAQAYRDNAKAIAEQRAELEQLATAYTKAQRAGESMIDGVLGRLLDGDWKGALNGLLKDVLKYAAGLQGNDIKNGLYGTDYPTAETYGGWAGALGSLVGLGRPSNVSRVQAAANDNWSGLRAAIGLSAPIEAVTRSPLPAVGSSVAEQAWNFFSSKGLADHQVAGILGHIRAESNFNPKAIGDGGQAFGLFQHHPARGGGQSLIAGGAARQLDLAWRELQGPEGRVLAALRNAGNVREATAAFAGFERPRGFSWANPEGSHNFSGRLSGAEAALAQFGGKTAAAARNVDQMATASTQAVSGLGTFGDALTKIISGATGGAGWSLSNLFGLGLSNRGAGFMDGRGGGFAGLIGYAGGTDYAPGGWARIFEQGGEIVDLPQGSRVIPHDVSMAMARTPQAGPQINISRNIHNNAGVDVREEDSDDGQGGIRTDIYIERVVAKRAGMPGSGIDRALRSRGAQLPKVRR